MSTPDTHHNAGVPFRTRTPHHPAELVPAETLLSWWQAARSRTFDAEYHLSQQPLDVEDYWTELALGTRLASDITAGRWVVTTHLLDAGAITTWRQLADALAIPAEQALAEYRRWLTGQVDLHERSGIIGISPDRAAELTALAEAVTW